MHRTAAAASPFRPALSLWIEPEPCAPPPMSVVGAVLAFGDVRDEQEDGTVLVRFSPARIEREDVRLLLGADRCRALDVSILWDDDQSQVVRVIDLAPLRAATAIARSRSRYAEARMKASAEPSGDLLAA